MRRTAKPSGVVPAAPWGNDLNPGEGIKGQKDHIAEASRARGALLIATLNDRWRVVDDPLQWILQVRKGRPTLKATGWRGKCFCTQRTALLGRIGQICGEVDPAALEIIHDLPERHPSSRFSVLEKRKPGGDG